MLAASKSLAEITAAEVMTRDLVVIPQHLALRQAARLLWRAHVSGAPVVDAAGRCVGVISATDFVHWAEGGGPGRPRRPSVDCVCADWQVLDAETLPADAVAAYMTRDPVTAPTTASVRDLAQRMLDAHIHRVIIVDADERPVGIVSSTDILAAVARREDGQ
jgi:CBS domain-containing protein